MKQLIFKALLVYLSDDPIAMDEAKCQAMVTCPADSDTCTARLTGPCEWTLEQCLEAEAVFWGTRQDVLGCSVDVREAVIERPK
jgi:hypothetical protein